MSRSNQTTQFQREPIRDPKHVMRFGKYKDIAIDEIMEVDPKYLLWLHDNTNFELHADLYDEIHASINEWYRDNLRFEFDHYKS